MALCNEMNSVRSDAWKCCEAFTTLCSCREIAEVGLFQKLFFSLGRSLMIKVDYQLTINTN